MSKKIKWNIKPDTRIAYVAIDDGATYANIADFIIEKLGHGLPSVSITSIIDEQYGPLSEENITKWGDAQRMFSEYSERAAILKCIQQKMGPENPEIITCSYGVGGEIRAQFQGKVEGFCLKIGDRAIERNSSNVKATTSRLIRETLASVNDRVAAGQLGEELKADIEFCKSLAQRLEPLVLGPASVMLPLEENND
jgi:hypothetical protein